MRLGSTGAQLARRVDNQLVAVMSKLVGGADLAAHALRKLSQRVVRCLVDAKLYAPRLVFGVGRGAGNFPEARFAFGDLLRKGVVDQEKQGKHKERNSVHGVLEVN